VRAGPKPEITAGPLDLSALPRSGARRVDAFAREYLTVTRGKGAKGPFRLRGWQSAILRRLLPASGPRPRQALLSMPRGNGKTSLAAVLGAFGLYADGVESAEVVVVASDARQAGITLRQIARMVQLEPRLAEQTQVFQSRLYVPHTDSTLVVLPAEPGALQGWNPSLAIVDELHVVTRAVWDAVSLAAGKRDRSLTLAISTPGPAREGVMWDLVEHGRRGDDPSFVFVEYAAPEDCEVDDEDAWHVANPALDDFLYVDALRSTMRTTREADFRRYRLGQWTQHADAWLPREAWLACTAARPIPDDADVVLGFDGSYSGDATAIVAVELGDVPHLDVVRVWESTTGEQVPIVDVEDALREACKRWRVQTIVADPFRWARSLQMLADEGLPVEEFPQSAQRMTPATQRFGEAVLNRALTHSGHPDLARHVGNAVVRNDSRGHRIVKEHKDSTRRIDLAVAAVMAFAAASTTDPAPQFFVFDNEDLS
jgi:phage terminase large subunit-like protein